LFAPNSLHVLFERLGNLTSTRLFLPQASTNTIMAHFVGMLFR
jgi:hypothetical protein